MRKIAPLAAVALFAALAGMSSSVPAAAQDLNPNTTTFLKALANPYAATMVPAAPAKMHRKHSKKKM